MVKYFTTGLLVTLAISSGFGQSKVPMQLVRTTGTITLDGKLDDAAWEEAPVISDFIQCLPKIGAAPTEKTEVRLLYDDNFLYIGLTAYDSFPQKIMATGLERDVYYGSDDNFQILIDTYNDKRQGILLSANALSARFDEEVLDNGNSFNAAYNTFWNVRSTRNASGFTTEFQIPFSSIRFVPKEYVIMGLKVIRYIRHKNEFDVYPVADATLSNAIWRVNNAQEIQFSNLKSRVPFYIIPYAKATFQQTADWNAPGSRLQTTNEVLHRNNFVSHHALDKVISNLGVDIKYGLSKNFTLDVTLNTDFAQAESDNRILNFTRFAVNLPEKRNFFLESKDYLNLSTGSGLLLFNSRTIGIEKGVIVPIIGGIRVSGKATGFQLGVLDLQTHGIEAESIAPQHFSVLRLRKEVWGNGSYVGGIVANRVSTDGNSFNNQTIGVDGVKRFRDNKWIAGLAMAATNDKRSGFFNTSTMASLNLSRVATVGYNHSTLLEYAGEHFKPMSGFAADSSYLLTTISNGFTWKWKDSRKSNLYWFTHSATLKHRLINHTEELVTMSLELGNAFKNGANLIVTPFAGREYLPYPWNFRNDIVIPLDYYSSRGIKLTYEGKQTGRLNYTVTTQYNQFYGGRQANLSLNGYYAINKNFRVTYKYQHNSFDFPKSFSESDQGDFHSNLLAVGVNYTSSIYFSIKALVQYDDVSKTIGSNLRLRFNPKEGTDLYIVYNPRINTSFSMPGKRDQWLLDQQLLIIKFSKALSL